MKKYLPILFAILVAVSIVGMASSVSAEAGIASTITDLKFPIAELGGCDNPGKCQAYCDSPDNMDVCLGFAEKNGLLDKKDIELGRKVAQKVKEGKTPGQCKTKAECESFCAGKTENIVECVAFAEELGVLPPEELAQAKKVIEALKAGAKLPGECKDKEECDNYCKEDGHFDECIGFAEVAGFVSKEDAEMARKVGGKGPGNCKSKDACENYCNDEKNSDECFSFAMDKGLIPEEQLKEMKSGIEKMMKGLDMVPEDARPEVENCLKQNMGEAGYSKMINSGVITDKNVGGKIQGCFENTMKDYAKKMQEKYTGEGKGGPEGGIPGGIPEEAKGEVEKIQKEMMNRKEPPSAEEIQNIKNQMMEKYAPKGIPEGYGPKDVPQGGSSENYGPKDIPQGYGPQGGAPGNYGPKDIPQGYGPQGN